MPSVRASIFENLKSRSRKKNILFMTDDVGIIVSICSILVVTSIYFINNNSKENTGTVKLVQRSEWRAKPPKSALKRLTSPVSFVIISHTATRNCFSKDFCSLLINYIQKYHFISRGWFDIGYNFLIGGDGAAYEGRGWQFESSHAIEYKSTSIGIAFLGTFTNIKSSKKQIEACKNLIETGVKLGYIEANYKILVQTQLYTKRKTKKGYFYEDVKTWKRWATIPTN